MRGALPPANPPRPSGRSGSISAPGGAGRRAMEPEELTGLALEAAVGAGAGYADARWVREETGGLTVTDDRGHDLEDRAAVGPGAGYADARWVREETEGLTVTDDRVDDLEAEESSGLGVRVLVDGRWGFAASAVLDPARARELAARAVEVARASAALPGEPVRLAPAGPAGATSAPPPGRGPRA